MIVGVDFDNTLVCYDAIFHRAALERGLIPPEVPATKTDVRDYLRRTGNEPAFTELQGLVYGPRIVEAAMFPGAADFFRMCRERGVTVKIISHKTRFPYAGERHDLHAAARAWLEHNAFFAADGIALPTAAVFFELTKETKLARIRAENCDVFIDDLPELLADPAFPEPTQRVLFDPANQYAEDSSRVRVRSWEEIGRIVLQSRGEGAVRDGLLVHAGAMLERLNRHLVGAPERLAGGANNRVFAARDERGGQFLLKQYFFDAKDTRDRFESERRFYQLATLAAPGQTPRAFEWDETARLGLLEFVDGRKLSAGEIGATDMDAALVFFRALNCQRESHEARDLPLAAEACFTPAEHCSAVDRRMARLVELPADAAIDREARDFVRTELAPAWADVRVTVLGASESKRVTSDIVVDCERCVSPSDFGFHNSLRRPDGSIVFLDFEYAGWDDPAKMVCDFFCQPALPAPPECFEAFAAEVGRAVGSRDPGEFVGRCRLLLPLYRLKWCGIMLNEFVRVDRGRRAFALGEGAAEERKATQLAAARRSFAVAREIFHGTAP